MIHRTDYIQEITKGRFSGGKARFSLHDFEPQTDTAPHLEKTHPLLVTTGSPITYNFFVKQLFDATDFIESTFAEYQVRRETMIRHNDFADIVYTIIKDGAWRQELMVRWREPFEYNIRGMRGDYGAYRVGEITKQPLIQSIHANHRRVIKLGGGENWLSIA